MSKVLKKPEILINDLPHGAQKVIAKKAGVSTDTVRSVIKGRSQNLSVMKAIQHYLSEFKEVKDGITTTAQELSFATN